MLCSYCRGQVDERADICPYCGAKIEVVQGQSNVDILNSTQGNNMQDTSADIILHNNKVQNKGNKRKVFIVIIVILLIVIIVVLIRNIVISNTESNSDLVKEISSCDAVNERDLENAKNGNFLMSVDSVSSGKNDEVIVTGCIRGGSISLNDEVEALGLNYENVTAIVSGINNEGLDYAEVGDTVDVVLDGVEMWDKLLL